MRTWRRWLGRIAIVSGIIAVTGGMLLWSIGFFEEPDWSRLKDQRESSILYAENNEVLQTYCNGYCREIIEYGQMGKMPEYAIAAEDRDFWRRLTPVSGWGIARALIHDLITFSLSQGGSTISQQTARILFAQEELDAEETAKKTGAKLPTDKFWRKGRELWFAILLEQKLSRKEVLELYLNSAYCGAGRYGVQACSRYWFKKNPDELTAGDAAWITGLWRSPHFAAAPQDLGAKFLRNRVLAQFTEAGVITEKERQDFSETSPPVSRETELQKSGKHAAEFIRRQMISQYLFTGRGFRVLTTIMPRAQITAARALHESMQAMKERNPDLANDLRGVAILIDAQSGAIKAFAQEPPFEENEYLIDQMARHTGSAFKPFFYAAWLARSGRLSCSDEGTGPCKLDDSYGRGDGKSGLSLFVNRNTGRKFFQNFPYEGLPRYIGMAEPIRCITESRNVCTISGVQGIAGSRVPAGERIPKEEILALALRLGVRPEIIDPEEAKARGINTITGKTAQHYGIPENTVDPGHTIAIGSIDVSPYDMAIAWTAFMGNKVEPYAIEEIISRDGRVEQNLFGAKPSVPVFAEEEYIQQKEKHKEKIINSEGRLRDFTEEEIATLRKAAESEAEKLSWSIMRGLRATVELPHGTGQAAKRELDFPVMGKTGTATNQKGETTDNWFIGCSPSFCMAVWIGREQKLPMKTYGPNGKEIQETGGKNALPVFIKTMKAVYEIIPKEQFPEATDPKKPFRYSRAPEPLPAEPEKETKTPDEESKEENKNDY